MAPNPTFSATPLSNDELSAGYADLRRRCVELARSLTVEQSNQKTPCCPEWSVKDVIAHLGGITTDILTGNLEGAATEAWADGHVADRADKDMTAVCDEWEANGPKIDEILTAAGNDIDPRFFIDAFTHEWDIRQATGAAAVPDLRFVNHTWPAFVEAIEDKNGGPLPAEVDPFTLIRAAMGRRSRSQISDLGLDPDGVVMWSTNPSDIIDPVLDSPQ